MDWRLTPANDRVAELSLKDQVEGLCLVEGKLQQVRHTVADLHREPGHGRRERQLLWGDGFRVLDHRDGFAFGRSDRDGYCGWISEGVLGHPSKPTHVISVRGTFGFSRPDLKEFRNMPLSFGSRVTVDGTDGAFARTAESLFIPSVHLRPIDDLCSDPVEVAELFLGTPYLWGGNSGLGIDCSGLVQAAMLACGITCPGDSDLQQSALGYSLSDIDSLRRGDLLFWNGHVAMAVDAETLIHANAHSMSVAYEPIAATIERIEANGDGPVTSRRRI